MAAPFSWMSVQKKNSSNGRSPAARWFPSMHWSAGTGWTAVFPASRSSFFAVRGIGRGTRPSSWKEALRARRTSSEAGYSHGSRRGFRFGAYASSCLALRRNRLLPPGFLPEICPHPSPPSLPHWNGGLFSWLCHRKWLMLFSLKFHRDNRQNALALYFAKRKTGEKGCIFTALWS